MEKRSRLGRGLSSLLNSSVEDTALPTPGTIKEFSGTPTEPPLLQEMFHVELSSIFPNANQPRKQFDESALQALARSVASTGIIQPIVVRAVEDHYEVIAGERRWRAAKIAGLDKIPVLLKTADALQQSRMALIENIHREDLNPIERAVAYRRLLNEGGYTQQELATQLGEDRSGIANYLRLLDLEESVRALLLDGKLTFGHAKLLAGVEDPAEQVRLAEVAVVRDMSVRELERFLKEAPVEKPVPKVSNAHIAALERQLSRDLQMRAEVRQATRGSKGRLVIHYSSLDQFDELMGRLGVKLED